MADVDEFVFHIAFKVYLADADIAVGAMPL